MMSLMASAPAQGRIIRPRNEAPLDAAEALQALHEAVNEQRTSFEARIAAVEAGQGTAELDERIARIEASIVEAEEALAAHATALAAGGGQPGGDPRIADPDVTNAFNDFFRQGEDRIEPDVRNALRRSSDADGGYLAPVEWDRTILEAQVELSPIRQISNVQSVSGAGFEKLINTKGTAAGWVTEEAARPQTAAAAFTKLGFGWGEIYAMPAATQTILDDAEVDLEEWLADEVAEAFTLMENAAFIAGNGVAKPRGLLTYVEGGVNQDRNPLGRVGTVSSGAAAAVTSDAIISMTYEPTSRYMQDARFIMNRRTRGVIRVLKDGNGNYLWQPTAAAGEPSTLFGYALTEIADMPDLAAGALPIAFGDFRQGYTIYDRKGVKLLRDPYTAKPYVLFYTTKRVGGAVTDPNAFRIMKVEAAA